MIRSATRYFCLVAVAFSLTTLPILQTANAAIISTDGAMDYVEKPFKEDELLEFVNKCVIKRKDKILKQFKPKIIT